MAAGNRTREGAGMTEPMGSAEPTKAAAEATPTRPAEKTEPAETMATSEPAKATEPTETAEQAEPTLPAVIETQRLVLRPWRVGDLAEAEVLFALASDPQVGPRCGWMPHHTVRDSLETIAHVFTGAGNRAITLRGDDRPIGCVELRPMNDDLVAAVRGAARSGALADDCALDEASLTALTAGAAQELGYWLGRRYWGHGYMTEALRAMLRRAFADLNAPAVWGEHHLSNPASGRVMERCELRPVCVRRGVWYPLTKERHDCLVRMLPAARTDRSGE